MSDKPNLAAALVAALADLTVIEKGRTATIPTKTGGNYTYSFADIADIVKLTRPALNAHGLVALTPVHACGDGLGCTVVLLHSSGEMMDFGPFPFPHGVDARATGSMVTYHRRYALVAALGMAAGDDDDGETAAAAPRNGERTAPSGAKGNAPSCVMCGSSLAGADVEKAPGGWAHKGGTCPGVDGGGEAAVPATAAPPSSAKTKANG